MSAFFFLGWYIYVGLIIINTECLTWQTLFYITLCPVLQCWPIMMQLQATLKHAPFNWISLAPGKVKLWETLSLRRVNTHNRWKEEREWYCFAARQRMNWLFDCSYYAIGTEKWSHGMIRPYWESQSCKNKQKQRDKLHDKMGRM